ncbi:S49 family peptidase [Aromatoleum diolicum]|uniref:S49 family peptidase n=1 Tax=Aromatoleum diolicum TaxID=75796 RepID=A0ABX1QA40_9RHOO|nr:S49 family peptidase [Aromatoleum diolicum]NMG74054.1 S49 family peptidase [Aromatoleum diolicum]
MESGKREENWERSVLERLAFESLAEQRRRRRWGIFFKLLGFAYLSFLIYLAGDWSDPSEKLSDGKGYAAMVSIDGVIEAGGEAGAEQVIASLQSAFADRSARGVVLRVNSPGGSPVQAGMINDEVARLRLKRPDLKVVAVIEDVCASGGYYVAVAADNIYVDKASLVGSIGVLMDSFGFVGTMEKLGVERRLLSAGESKGFLDPFSPQRPDHLAHARGLLGEIHQQFIEVVRKGRGARLKEVPEMFSGLVWTGERSIALGLADDYGTVESVARDVFQVEEVRDFTHRRNLAERFAQRFGADVAESMMGALARISLR